MTQNDVMQLFIGKDVGSGSPTPSAADIISAAVDAQLLDGEMCVTNAHNEVLSAASCLTDDIVKESGIKVIQRSGSKLLESDLIMQETITNYRGTTGSAGAEQVSYIGFNGVAAGALEVNNSTLYVVRIVLRETSLTGQGQEIILNAPYKSDAAATQQEIGDGMAVSLNNVMKRQVVPPVRVDLVSDAAVDNADAFDEDATVVNGQNAFVCATGTAGGDTVVVGDYVRFSETPAVTGTALTDGLYKITAIDLPNYTVDRAIQAPSGSYTASKAVAEMMQSADVVAGDLGIKLTGIARTFAMPKWRYSKVSFLAGLDDGFGATTVSYTTAMSLGVGTYAQIAELEWDLLGNDGDIYRGDFLYAAHKTDADADATYSCLGLNYYGNHPTQGVGVTPRRSKQLVLAFAKGHADTEAADIVVDIFDAYTTQLSGLAV